MPGPQAELADPEERKQASALQSRSVPRRVEWLFGHFCIIWMLKRLLGNGNSISVPYEMIRVGQGFPGQAPGRTKSRSVLKCAARGRARAGSEGHRRCWRRLQGPACLGSACASGAHARRTPKRWRAVGCSWVKITSECRARAGHHQTSHSDGVRRGQWLFSSQKNGHFLCGKQRMCEEEDSPFFSCLSGRKPG